MAIPRTDFPIYPIASANVSLNWKNEQNRGEKTKEMNKKVLLKIDMHLNINHKRITFDFVVRGNEKVKQI